MKQFYIFILLSISGVAFAQPQIPQPEIQILFPDQAALVNGTYIDPNQGLIITTINGVEVTETFDLAGITGLNIPGNVAVTGFSVNNNPASFASTVGYVFSLSNSSGNFVRGDVIECDNEQCNVLDSFGINASISAIDFINRVNDLYVSFDTSFSFSGNWINASDVYRSSDLAVVFDASANGLSENNSVNAYDTSEFLTSFSTTKVEEIDNSVVKPSSVFSPSLIDRGNVLVEVGNKVSGINAYFSADTGWLEFSQNVINVSESSGSVSFNVARVNGKEYNLTAVLLNSDGTAVDGIDYEGIFSQAFFVDDSTDDREFSLNIIDNNIMDGTRTFTVQLLESNSNFRFSPINPNKNQLTINILDDDGDLIFADGFE